MSVNKNFVVKNGFEVSTDLILADANTRKVGIASTNPRYLLDVRGGIGVTDIQVSGIATISNQLRVGTGGTIFSVIAGPTGFGQSVGVGTASPSYLLDVRSSVSTGQTALYVQGDVRITGDLNVDDLNLDDVTTQDLIVTDTLLVGFNGGPGIATISTLGVTGLTTTRNLEVIGVSTFIGFSTFQDSVTIQDNLQVGGASTFSDSVTIQNLSVTGIATIANISVAGAAFTNITVSGISSLNGFVYINNSVDISNDLNVSGISTLGTVQISSGIITASSGIVTYYGDGQYLENVTRGVGLGTTGGIVGYGATVLYFQGPGISTITVSSGIATINISGSGSASIGIGSTPGAAGFTAGIVTAGNLWYNTNIGRLFIYYQDTDSAQWVDSAPFNVGIVTVNSADTSTNVIGGIGSIIQLNVSGISTLGVTSTTNLTSQQLNVSGLSTFAGITTYTTSLFGRQASFTGVVTASSFVGNLTGTASTASFSTTSFGLSGTPNITVGNVVGAAATFTNLTVNGTQTIINTTNLEISDPLIGIGSGNTTDAQADGDGIQIYGTTNKTLTYNNTKKAFETNVPWAPNETRIISGAEKVHRQSGNTVTLTYNSSSSSNVGYATNPTGDITVNVVGVPTSSDFDDHSITFAVIVNNTGTARTCTAVNLNGTSRTIRWAGGSLASAISGVTTTSGHTIFSFTGINTVGSASTTANYQVLGAVSGGFW